MRLLPILFFLLCSVAATAQDDAGPKPSYCEEAPGTYGTPGGDNAPSLPKFATTPTKEYKVQVAILRFTDPAEYPFHPSLVARFRPCEQVWVVESRQSFSDRAEAVALQDTLKAAGYGGSYITDLVAYQ
ncbi:hypothetical protein LEM8419_02625 [Neolewinella maritima]|uniref:SPOR domain-containing protein n=1 Tax=Neolewinella maritima TaxID=1383882 RepID=A0ABM9B3L6_9BACT|nr:hypothetical protein [Neolewinella maritima]CAH1001719.1 hypothetical protein LEM8419_02625 [Neolewinella maritima]